MGAVEDIQHQQTGSSESAFQPATSDAQFDAHFAWNQMSHLYVAQVHSGWWDQMPMGQSMAALSPYAHAHTSLVEHLNELFKVEQLPEFSAVSSDITELGLCAFQNWLDTAQQLGLMMLSVPLSMEIDGKTKQQFFELYGPFEKSLLAYTHEASFQQFYQCVTYKNLRLVLQTPPEQLLREASFQAWALLSLVLPKGATQRVHLTIPSEWVAEIQELRNRFSGNEALESIQSLTPIIAQYLTKSIKK